ncbi:MAG: hypothetical protein ACW972_10170 [Promethearchaeota archaeon]
MRSIPLYICKLLNYHLIHSRFDKFTLTKYMKNGILMVDKENNSYDADDITVLRGLDGVN